MCCLIFLGVVSTGHIWVLWNGMLGAVNVILGLLVPLLLRLEKGKGYGGIIGILVVIGVLLCSSR